MAHLLVAYGAHSRGHDIMIMIVLATVADSMRLATIAIEALVEIGLATVVEVVITETESHEARRLPHRDRGIESTTAP